MNFPFFKKKPTAPQKPQLQSSKQPPKLKMPVKGVGISTLLHFKPIRNAYLNIIIGDVKKVLKRDEKSMQDKMEYEDFMEQHFGRFR
jgi:hypothetical protein